MEIIVVGLNYRAAPVDVRECLAITPARLETAHTALLTRSTENVILSTCNRMEVYAVVEDGSLGASEVSDFLGEFHCLPCESFVPFLYQQIGKAAVSHLFTVAAGLDSMILGEPQILGQVRAAREAAAAHRAAGAILCRAFDHAVSVGKKVRSETAIGQHAVSVSYAAVELARKIFGTLAGRNVLVVGAGKMGELAARTLLDNGLDGLVVANRTHSTAVELAARFGGQAAEFSRLPELVAQADVVISSTGATGFVLTPPIIQQAMGGRRNRPLFLIDIAVPRDVDPQVQSQDNVYLYDIDDLHAVCAANLEERRKEVVPAREIIEVELADFLAWYESLRVVPTISALRQRAEEIRRAEISRALGKFGNLSERQRSTLEALTSSITNKMLHQPITRLKAKGSGSDGTTYARVVRELFALDEQISMPKQTSLPMEKR